MAMTQHPAPPVLIVLHLLGGNDALNTLVPYGNPLYYDSRPVVRIAEEQVLPIDNGLGFHPSMAALKPLYDRGQMAIIMGIGYPNRNYSHFRSTDIWETAEPSDIVDNGWLAKALREIDPRAENVLTAINFGNGLPRALSLSGVPVASVAKLDSYGLFPDIGDAARRQSAINVIARMYECGESSHPRVANPPFGELPAGVLQHAAEVGLAAFRGAHILGSTKASYHPMVQYPRSPIGDKLKSIAQVKLANVGTRIYYTSHGSFDLHANQIPNHAARWLEVSEAVAAFFADLRRNAASSDVILFIWSEFGRRVRDNGGGTDHGAGGLAFIIGDRVK